MNGFSQDLNDTNKFVSTIPSKKTPVLARDVDSKKFVEYKTVRFAPESAEILAPFPYVSVSNFNIDSVERSKFQPNKKTCTEDVVPFYSRSFYSFDTLETPPVSTNLVEFPAGMDTRN
jgi:hypothetical protein